MLDFMSPLPLRRYRAERLLRQEFEVLRSRVLGSVRGRLARSGVRLDPHDLEACYAQAWQGLYGIVLGGREIENPAAWLTLVTYRRALDEHRVRTRTPVAAGFVDGEEPPGAEPDLASALDDRIALRALIDGMRGRLDAREREAAALCYLHGMTRAEAAARMGLSARRMQRLMEGGAGGRPGVSAKMSELVRTIRAGGWCEEQSSLMRALAYGVLDPGGERYRLALAHRRGCPACRAYVASLRRAAAVMPPVLAPLSRVLRAAAPAGSAQAASAHAGSAHAAAAGAKGAAAGAAPSGVTVGAASAPAAGSAAAGGAGGGLFALGAPVGAKLAVGCLLALGVGAGCAALIHGSARAPHAPRPARARVAAAPALRVPARPRSAPAPPALRPVDPNAASAAPAGRGARAAEFSPERGAGSARPGPAAASPPPARPAAAPAPSVAEREFSPG
jgi:DNA-directed RNA polymerase specialized sigma24 family protein